MFDENYESKLNEIRESNDKHLESYAKWLEDKKLSTKTINKHLNNVDFYINYYLTYYDANDVTSGCYSIDGFLGNFFIRKALWSSVPQIKSTAASIKKFYQCMKEQGVVEEESYEYLCETIKENMDEWQNKMRAYDNLEYDEDEFFRW